LRSFFQGVPLKVRAGKESWAGHYTGQRGKDVALTSGFLSSGRKPALLHEFRIASASVRRPEKSASRVSAGFKAKRLAASAGG
jgi:hypothetical protein